MDEVLGFLILILYLIAASSSKKKKAKKNQARADARKRQDTKRTFPSVPNGSRQTAAAQPVHAEEACVQERIHIHETTQQQMELAGEGEDPCHGGNAQLAEEAQGALFSYDEEAQDENEFAQDVLRGVIMSEILTRPCDRMAVKRSGRRAV